MNRLMREARCYSPWLLVLALCSCGSPAGRTDAPASAPSVEAPVASPGAGAPAAGSGRPPAPTASAGPAAAPGAPPADAPRAVPPVVASAALVAPDPIRFEDAVDRAGQALLAQASAQLGGERRTLVIDPLIDANTGAQTVSTAAMGTRLESVVKKGFKTWSITPLTRDALAAKPLLLIGTLTPVNVVRAIDTPPDAFRVWLTLIDLRNGRVVAKQLDRSTVDSVNPEPLPFFRDSPTWHKDNTVLGYINSCQVKTNIGDPADPEYLARLPAAAVINEAILAYGDGKTEQAHTLYREAATIADPGDLRVLNGLYLTSWHLGQRDEAREAFAKLVDSGFELKRLPVKLLFQPGKTEFYTSGDLGQQYAIWLKVLSQEAGKVDACLRVVGHTSRTGSASANEALSRRRAEAVLRLISKDNRVLGSRLSAAGVGSREALIGLGTDDQRDALDRRVEFRVVDCV